MDTQLRSQVTPSRAPGVLLLDRDGRRCRDRLTAIARSGALGASQSVESIEDWRSRPDRIAVDILAVSADTFREDEIVESAAALEASQPGVRLVLADIPETARRASPPITLDAWACLPQGTAPAELVHRLRRVAEGRATLTGDRLGQVMLQLQEMIRLAPSGPTPAAWRVQASLTAREREVLGLMANRMSNQEIAAALHLQLGTVKNHVHSVLRKLGLQRREQAVYYVSGIAGGASASGRTA